jgi:hypothetical protein
MREKPNYPIYKDVGNYCAMIVGDKEAYSIQSTKWGEADGFHFYHFKSRAKILQLLKGTTITKEKFIENQKKVVGKQLTSFLLLSDSKEKPPLQLNASN